MLAVVLLINLEYTLKSLYVQYAKSGVGQINAILSQQTEFVNPEIGQ